MYKILKNKLIFILEDDHILLQEIEDNFINQQAKVISADSLQQAYQLLNTNKPDIAILDRFLGQGVDGIEILEHIRNTPSLENTAVIALTAKKNDEDIETAYQLKVDDYITKPFTFNDLNRRVEALLRRTILFNDTQIKITDDVIFNTDSQELIIKGVKKSLLALDNKLLIAFCQRRGSVMSRHQLINYVWGEDIDKHTIDISIYRLRKALDEFKYVLKTVPNAGYKLLEDIEISKNSSSLSLAGSIAHEMRNPLHKISLINSFIQDKQSKKELTQKDIEEMGQLLTLTVDKANNVIDLILNDIRSQKIDTSKFNPISVANVIRNALKLYPFNPGEIERIDLDIQQDFNIIGSATYLQYVIFNLLKNSIYYFDKKIDMSITISIISTANSNQILFKDTGIGIAQNKLKDIFQEFSTSGKQYGTGLGLCFCKRTVKAFGGDIRCRSQLGVYTEFTLSFPIKDIQLLKIPEREKLETSTLKLDNKRVLLIEDDSIARTLMKFILNDVQGLHLYCAKDGIEAVKQAKEINPDIIFTDLNVPKLTAVELVDSLSKLTPKPIIISLSGDQPEESVKAKLDDVLVKPIGARQVLDKLQQYCG